MSPLNEHLNQLYKIVEIKEKRNFNYYTIQKLTDDKNIGQEDIMFIKR